MWFLALSSRLSPECWPPGDDDGAARHPHTPADARDGCDLTCSMPRPHAPGPALTTFWEAVSHFVSVCFYLFIYLVFFCLFVYLVVVYIA